MQNKWIFTFLLAVCLLLKTLTSAQTVVEGFAGGPVTVRCTVNIQGDLQWTTGGSLILVRPANGQVAISDSTAYTSVVSLVGNTNNLRISSLDHARDNNRIFRCRGSVGGSQETPVRVLARITAARIDQTTEGQVRVKEGDSKVLTCIVSGVPNPAPSYSWSVDNREVSAPGPSNMYSLRADRSMKTVKCTATNVYSDGSELSREEGQATLNVLYLDPPMTTASVTVTENDPVTLQCSAEGNPPPTFQWKKSGREDVLSTSADYRIDNVQRSDAGEYRCSVINDAGNKGNVSSLIVQYPPDVNVTFDENTRTLTCTAQGVPDTYTFNVWTHRLGGADIRRVGTATNSYTFPGTLTYQDTGDYLCSVTNGIKSQQQGQTYVAPQTSAVFQVQPEMITIGLGKEQKISVSFYTKPSSGSVQVDWTKSGDSAVLEPHLETEGVVSLVFYNKPVSIRGTVTELTLVDVSEADKGNYTVTVKSDINGVTEAKSVSFYVNVDVIPDTPMALELGPIIGGAVGGLVLIIVIIVIIVFVLRRRSQSKGSSDGKEEKTSVNEKLVDDPERSGFRGSDWNKPGAEVADNELYESASFRARPLPPQDKRPPKPARTFEHNSVSEDDSKPKGGPHDLEMVENSLYVSADSKPGDKKNGAAKPKKAVKPMRPAKPSKPQLPIDDSYEDTDLSNAPSGANNNNPPSKTSSLNYQEVNFDKGKDSSRINSDRPPTNYADISFKRQ